MTTFKKLLISSVGSLAFGISGMASASNITAALPEISTLTSMVGSFIANELKLQLANAVAMPRPPRVIRPASVVVTDVNGIQVNGIQIEAVHVSASDRAELQLVRRVLEPRL